MSGQEIRYCQSSDGSRIAYTTYGEGSPAVVLMPGWAITFQMEAQFEEGVEFYTQLARDRMVIRYDLRGIGASSREVNDLSAESHVADVQAVITALALDQYDLFGCAFDSPIALLQAFRNHDQVRRLVLWGPYDRGDYAPRESSRAIIDLCKANWPLATRTLTDIIGVPTEHRGRWARLLRDAATPEVATAYIESRYDVDVSDVVERIKQPTLLMHRRGNDHIPIEICRDLASRLPNSRFIELAGRAEPWIFGYDDYLPRVLAFLSEGLEYHVAIAQAGRGEKDVRTILFTDLVGHTEMMSRLGDERGREVLREHERITRDMLKQHGGTEIKTMGDGFMASFGSVTKAVECAIDLQRAFATREGEPLSVRVGLNAGEPIEDEGDLFGATVILASRIAARAQGGEILVADTVRGLCSGKGFLFSDRGEFLAKGFEEPVRLYEVRWRE